MLCICDVARVYLQVTNIYPRIFNSVINRTSTNTTDLQIFYESCTTKTDRAVHKELAQKSKLYKNCFIPKVSTIQQSTDLLQ